MITTFGEIMMRISPQDAGERIVQTDSFRVEPGGSESNVAIALAGFGHRSQFVTRIPDNELRLKIDRYFKSHGVDQKFVIKGERIGMYWTEKGVGPRSSFVIYDREHSSFSNAQYEEFDWEDIFASTTWFHFSGISPAVSKSVSQLLEKVVENCKCPYSVDLNYRKKLWQWVKKDASVIGHIMTNLCKNALLIAGNETDFVNIFDFSIKDTKPEKPFSHIAEQAFDRFPNAKYIAISNRESLSASRNDWNGYLFVKKGISIHTYVGVTYQIENIIDRVGTGDSFVAGIIHGLTKFADDYQKIVDFAVTVAALKHTIHGDASFFSEEDVLLAMDTRGSGRIIR